MVTAPASLYCPTCGHLTHRAGGQRHCSHCEQPTAAEAHAAMQALLQEWPRNETWPARWLQAQLQWRTSLV